MKFNTLTFDANLPTVQQVNVPTNSDYKVGMKVKRNGEVQQLGPDEITIYTGEITPGDTTVVGPSDSPSYLERTVNGTNKTTIFMMFPTASLSAYANKFIAPSDIEQTWHLSGETTSTPLDYGDLEMGYGVQYVEGTTVWWSYQGKWCRTASGQIVEKKDRVQIKDTALMRQTFNLQTSVAEVFFNGTIPTAEAPILVDSTITFHDADTPVTIPTDADKTNGYVTFTQAAGDEASFRQLSVVVDTRVPSDQEEKHTSGDSASQGSTFYAVYSLPAESAGKRIYADTVKVQYSYDQGSTWMDFEDFNGVGVTFRSQNGPVYGCFCKNVLGDTGKWHLQTTSGWETSPLDYVEIPDSGNPYMYLFYSTTNGMTPTPTQWPIRFRLSFKVGNPATGFTANFKLNVNEFKSQCGDINVQTDPDFNTAKVEGTYADGTEFSYDFCIQ